MNLANPLLLLGLAALPLSARAFADAQDGPTQLAPAKPAAAASDAATLVKQLGDEDYKTRKAAFRALEKLGPAARAELQKAAKSDDPEVRWSASLLLDRLADDDDTQELRPPRDAAPDDDPFDGFGNRFDDPLFRDAIRQMNEAMRRMNGLSHSFARSANQGGSSHQESTSIRIDANGHVTVEQEKDGEKTTVQADSIEALRKEHPELVQGLGGLGGFGGMRFRIAPPAVDDDRDEPLLPAPRPRGARAKGSLEQPQARPSQLREEAAPRGKSAPADAADATNKPRLGVQVAPVKADVAEYLELDDGVGLEVVRVVAGSAAEKLGIQVRDIITEVNGRTIQGVDDVAKALGGKDPAEAEVTVLRRGVEKSLDPRKNAK